MEPTVVNGSSPTESTPSRFSTNAPRVLLATTALLSFITFWQAAAVVLNDMGSSAFYAGAIAENFVGKTAPWFILAIMLIAYAVRSLYIESCSMFVRGGVYRVVKEAMGSTLAKFSVSALMFDYILTGPISGVSAGLYLVGLLNEVLHYFHSRLVLPVNETAAVFAILVTVYFWWENIKGIHESSEKALKIMYVTTVMVVIMLVWCGYTLWVRGAHLPPLPTLTTLTYSKDALGWLTHSKLPYTVGLIGVLIGLGHSVLAMSGEETLAQVYREVQHPKLKNLEKAGFVIFVYSLVFTAGVAFFAVMIIPDSVRANFFDNPIGGLAMYLVGPLSLRLLFRGFIVVVGTLMLAGAVNTAIVGSNGVLNRVSEDGILPGWFRQPHKKFGTSYRTLNLVVGLQIFTIILSRGNIFMLGEAYAFGVMWSFAMKSLAVLVLRFTEPGPRDFRVPLNLRIGRIEVPIGLGLITLTLVALCTINLFTKQVATMSGVAFTIVFFGVFTISEKLSHKQGTAHAQLDQFNLEPGEGLTPKALGVRPGNILVMVRDYNTLHNLSCILDRIDTRKHDVVVLHLRLLARASSGEHELEPDQLFGVKEQTLFTQALSIAEKRGKTIHLAVAPATDKWDGIMRAAQSLETSGVVLGVSPTRSVAEEARVGGLAWERLEAPRPNLTLEILTPEGNQAVFYLGPHAPHLTAKEIELLHAVWLDLSTALAPEELHHHDVIHFALQELKEELRSENPSREILLAHMRDHLAEIKSRRITTY
jgi:amino acid transporter